MIFLGIINVFVFFLGLLFFYFPHVDILPFGIDSILVQASGYLHFIASLFPPLAYLLQAFIYYLTFLLLFKLFMLISFVSRMFRH